jgi:hypothetical protein
VTTSAEPGAAGDRCPLHETELTQLRRALSTRPTINLAKGVVMAVRRCDEDAAFADLVRVSRHHNLPVAALAEALVDTVAGADREPGTPGIHGLGAAAVVQREWVSRLSGPAGGGPAE